jgi:hypothetical protein
MPRTCPYLHDFRLQKVMKEYLLNLGLAVRTIFFICIEILEFILFREAYLADVSMYCLYYWTLFGGLKYK